jgi:hypothetical protein
MTATRWTCLRTPAARSARGMTNCSARGGRGECRVPMHPQPRVRMIKSTRASHHRYTGNTRHSRTQWLERFPSCSPRRRIPFATVIRGSGLSRPGWADAPPRTWHQQRMPGPHDFAVRGCIVRPARRRIAHRFEEPALRSPSAPDAAASTASRTTFVTIAIRPSLGRDGARYKTVSTGM